MRFSKSTLLASSLSLASAIYPPTLQGFDLTWSDSFTGCQGCAPNSDTWNVALDVNVNEELETYTAESSNIQLSGGETLQLVPWKADDGSWTSGRIESKPTFTPTDGKKFLIQAAIRMGDAANKQGMWPAFWMLGDSMRHGTVWPLCGELDILEQINGVMTGYGTVHCGVTPGGICNEPSGLGAATTIPDDNFHTWSLAIDRTSGNWETETITWMMDGNVFHELSGSDMGDMGTWATLAHSPLYVILNVAVGGSWPGDPNDATEDGYGNMMEVQYLGVYESS